jgi:acyl-coenzyme A thioesterase PaaI-like protein
MDRRLHMQALSPNGDHLRIDYLRPERGHYLAATGRVVRLSGRVAVAHDIDGASIDRVGGVKNSLVRPIEVR